MSLKENTLIQINSDFVFVAKTLGIIVSAVTVLPTLWLMISSLNVGAMALGIAVLSMLVGFLRGFWLKLPKVMYDYQKHLIYVNDGKLVIKLEDIKVMREEMHAVFRIFPMTMIEYKLENGRIDTVYFLPRKRVQYTRTGDAIRDYFQRL